MEVLGVFVKRGVLAEEIFPAESNENRARGARAFRSIKQPQKQKQNSQAKPCENGGRTKPSPTDRGKGSQTQRPSTRGEVEETPRLDQLSCHPQLEAVFLSLATHQTDEHSAGSQ